MGELRWTYRMVREPLRAMNREMVLRFRYVETQRDGSRVLCDPGRHPWGDTPADLARLLGDLAEALTRPILVELDGRLVEETP